MHNSIIVNDERVCDSKVKDFIRTEFKNSIKRDYPIVEFIRRVWKFEPSSIPQSRPDGGAYFLPHDICNKYLSSPDYMKQLDPDSENGKHRVSLQPRSETKACQYFEELFKETTDMVKEACKHRNSRRFEQMGMRRYRGKFRFLNEAIVHGNYADYKPDFSYATRKGSEEGKVEWAGQGCVREVKRREAKRAQKLRCDIQIDLRELQVRPTLIH